VGGGLTPLREWIVGDAKPRLVVLLAAVALLLLVACANVASLLFARAGLRAREMALRSALGAGRGRLLRQLLTETLLLAALGGVGGVLVARWGGAVLRRTLLPQYAWDDAAVDGRVLAVSVAAVLAVALLTAVLPLVQATRADVVHDLRAGAREGGGRRSAARSALLVAQAALCTLLLVGAGLFVRSLRNARGVDLGYEPGRVLAIGANLEAAGFDSLRAAETNRLLHARAARAAGVERAALARGGPGGWMYGSAVKVPGRDSVPTPSTGGPYFYAVSPEFFPTLGMRVLRGRTFESGDRPGAAGPVIVSETMARLIWPGRSPLGECIQVLGDDACRPVIGVVADMRRGVEREGMMQFFVQLDPHAFADGQFMVYARVADGGARGAAEPVRRVLQGAAPDLPFVGVQPLQELADDGLRSWRLGATMFTAFGALALVTAIVGLYGVLAYMVARRSHEMGVRLALGARPRNLIRLVLRQGAVPVAVGALVGGGVALVAGRFVEPLLYEVRTPDPRAFAAAGLLLAVCALAAGWLPARRAARVDPMIALREE
jgi:predicted permease